MAERERKPHIITDETEAIAEYGRLMAMNFEVCAAGVPLTEGEFVLLCESGGEVIIRNRGYQSEGHWEIAEVNVPPEEAAGVYAEITQAGYEMVLPEAPLTEDEFVTLAAEKGRVDMKRVRPDGRVMRYYGTQIGRSNSPVLKVPSADGSAFLN